VILDNASPHKSRKTTKWLKEHPNSHFHFIPTSASWMNPVEGVFSKVARGVQKNRFFASIKTVRAALKSFLRQHNKNTAPFPSSRDPADIIARGSVGAICWKQSTRIEFAIGHNGRKPAGQEDTGQKRIWEWRSGSNRIGQRQGRPVPASL